MAEQIALNGKTQRPSVCNAIETILIHQKWFDQYGEQLLELHQNGVEIYGDEKVWVFPKCKICNGRGLVYRISRFGD